MAALSLKVQTLSGPIQGSQETSSKGHIFLSFKGIRYAEPPVRFEEAKPVKNWTEVKKATSYGSSALQHDAFANTIKGSEDCLFLNVFSRAQRADDNLAVIVYIHGGGYAWGSGNDEFFGPLHAMNEPMVLVTLNYRLGPLGFMPPMEGLFPANLGLKDQRLAVQWIKVNVQRFGGNPDNITLMGESAGATSVWHQYLHPATETDGLFHKIIAQGGSPLAHWATVDPDLSKIEMDKYLSVLFKGHPFPKGQELREKLAALPATNQ